MIINIQKSKIEYFILDKINELSPLYMIWMIKAFFLPLKHLTDEGQITEKSYVYSSGNLIIPLLSNHFMILLQIFLNRPNFNSY
jgi:hypothetical protein